MGDLVFKPSPVGWLFLPATGAAVVWVWVRVGYLGLSAWPFELWR